MNASTIAMVDSLKNRDEDFEWYPTTKEIINTIKLDYSIQQKDKRHNSDDSPSVLDCGAGDGRVLEALTDGKKYAIEKARPLLNALSKDIFVVGTDFNTQTLIDKRVSILYSNPPYKYYHQWATKIIQEANAGYIYLVLPTRWQNSVEIKDLIKLRNAEFEVIGHFDFLAADRQARAEVDVIRICLTDKGRYSDNRPKVDPFRLWFSQSFKLEINKEEKSKYDYEQIQKKSLNERLTQELVQGVGLIDVLEKLYIRDLDRLLSTYRKLCSIDTSILNELNVNLDAVRGALEHKIENIKDNYWRELFDRLNTVTDKLTSASRENLLSTLTAHTHVDFTSDNAHAVVMWVIKNANQYMNNQIISMVERMTEKANVQAYKSNQKTFGSEDWRYCRTPDIGCYKLDYRIVLERVGGLSSSTWRSESTNGLANRAATFINDLCTIATNLNYDTYGLERANTYEWASRDSKVFEYRVPGGGLNTLFEVRAFKNGNLHIKLNSLFICRLNLEFGRLKGWLKTPKEAADELDIPITEAEQSFNSNFQLADNSLLKLGFEQAA